jgi:hypothetical protein
MRHLSEEDQERIVSAMVQDIYAGLVPTLKDLGKEHCGYCASAAVGNSLLRTAVWVFSMPYATDLCTRMGRGDDLDQIRDCTSRINDKALAEIGKVIGPLFQSLFDKMEEDLPRDDS